MSAVEAMRRELEVSLRLNHPGIVLLLGTAMVGSPLPALVSQWMPSGTLSEYLERAATRFTLPARYGLVSCLYQPHTALIDSRTTRLKASLKVSHIVRRCPPYRHFSLFNAYIVHSEDVIHGDLHPVCMPASLYILRPFINFREISS